MNSDFERLASASEPAADIRLGREGGANDPNICLDTPGSEEINWLAARLVGEGGAHRLAGRAGNPGVDRRCDVVEFRFNAGRPLVSTSGIGPGRRHRQGARSAGARRGDARAWGSRW
jgi:hypothetical protein